MSGLIDALAEPRLNGGTSLVHDPIAAEVEDLDVGTLVDKLDSPNSGRKRRRRSKQQPMKTYPPEEGRGADAAGDDEDEGDPQRTLRQKCGILICYLLVSVLWLALVHLLGLAPWTGKAKAEHINKPLSWVVLFLPLFVFGLAALSVWTSGSVCSVQNAVRGGNILYLGMLVAIPLFTLLDSNYQGDRTHFSMVVLTSITCAVLGQLDVWGTSDWTCYVHHIESSLKTISIGLLLYALVMFAFNGKYFSKAS